MMMWSFKKQKCVLLFCILGQQQVASGAQNDTQEQVALGVENDTGIKLDGREDDDDKGREHLLAGLETEDHSAEKQTSVGAETRERGQCVGQRDNVEGQATTGEVASARGADAAVRRGLLRRFCGCFSMGRVLRTVRFFLMKRVLELYYFGLLALQVSEVLTRPKMGLNKNTKKSRSKGLL